MFSMAGYCNVSTDAESPTQFLLVRFLLFHNVVFSFHGNLLEFQPFSFFHRPNPDHILLLFLRSKRRVMLFELLVLDFCL